MGQAPYRSEYRHLIGARLTELRRTRTAVEPILPRLDAIRSRRIARAIAGATGIAGAAAMVLFTCAGEEENAVYALIASWPAMMIAWTLARLATKWAGRIRLVHPLPKLTGQLDVDLIRIAQAEPAREIEGRLDRLELASTALPLAALSLLVPLSLHLVAIPLLGCKLRDYGFWVRISLMIVGHAHLVLMALAIAFARKMKQMTLEQIAEMRVGGEWAKAWGLTIAVSAMPGLIFLAVPPILTAITGVVFIPAMFIWMRDRVMEERSLNELAEDDGRLRIATPTASIEDVESWDDVAQFDEPQPQQQLAARL